MNTAPGSSLRVTPQIILGLLIVAFGIILTLDNLDYVEAGDILRYWPLAAGGVRARQDVGHQLHLRPPLWRHHGPHRSLADGRRTLGVPIDFERWWPMILVAIGGLILFRAFRGGA